MSLDNDLREETKKWLGKLESLKIHPKDKKGEEFLSNINAYISDSKYFLEKEDLIRAFEAVVWAWAWYEIGREIRVL